ncbi:DNA primase [Ferrovibrio sp.]|uniref:DNA primase n=1 Tax=Ferrovibrio sp. TaxID=1917215 RepID=UPI0035B0FF6D
MAFPDSFLEELRNRVPLSGVVGRSVRLIRRGREFSGLCPFHNEKSPSFTVNDDKGFFHCFGCGAHGDVIGFVMRHNGLPFPDAVEQLAAEAGLQVPQSSPQDRERAEQAASLGSALEAAAEWYRAQLNAQAGREGKAYLERRGLKPETIERFRLGFAPNSRTGLLEAMRARKIPDALLVEAGMVIKSDDGELFDRFRNRVMFPIADRRGRVIAFGGRAMDPNAPAKYLNSPETAVFHKGHTLYNLAMAREAAHAAGTVLVVEGYMDVIALAQAGFEYAVAPLGTALTEEQIALLWRMAAEPVLCFDGDKAGMKAALRAVDRALPLLEPGKSLRFALLPGGQDPDDLIKAQGRDAMEAVLAAALPMAEMLWRKETEGQPIDTPERRAALQAQLYDQAGRIKNTIVQQHYRDHLRERLRGLFNPGRQGPGRNGPGKFGSGPGGRGGPRPGGFSANPWAPGGKFGRPLGDTSPIPQESSDRREKALLLGFLLHPWLAEDHSDSFAGLTFRNAALDSLKSRILEETSRHPGLDGEALVAHLKGQGLQAQLELLDGETGRLVEPFTRADSPRDKVERGWIQAVQRYRLSELEQELAVAQAELADNMSPEAWGRFSALQAELGSVRSQVSASDEL